MPSRRKLIIGTRGSQLALWQANFVRKLLESKYPNLSIELSIIKTRGDVILDSPLSKIGDKGLFTREIESALLNGTIDMAVHSMKDLPTSLPDGLIIGAILEREDPRDAFVSLKYPSLDTLPEGAVMATSSLRRKATLLHHRPDLTVVDVRGNLDTRLRKLKENGYDGMILAFSGLKRMNMLHNVKQVLSLEFMLPAVSQGALGVEIRDDDEELTKLLSALEHSPTRNAVLAERSFLHELGGGCQVPIGAYASVLNDSLKIEGFVANLDGTAYLRSSCEGTKEHAELLGTTLAKELKAMGAKDILDDLYGDQHES